MIGRVTDDSGEKVRETAGAETGDAGHIFRGEWLCKMFTDVTGNGVDILVIDQFGSQPGIQKRKHLQKQGILLWDKRWIVQRLDAV